MITSAASGWHSCSNFGYCVIRQYCLFICENWLLQVLCLGILWCERHCVFSGYSVSVETVNNNPYGRAKVKHMGYWGYICPNGFDNNAANVICKEAGYAGGVSFDYYQYRYRVSSDIHWLSNVDCAGTESYLTRCKNVVWGNMTQCSRYGDAAVFCYQNSGEFEFMIVGEFEFMIVGEFVFMIVGGSLLLVLL